MSGIVWISLIREFDDRWLNFNVDVWQEPACKQVQKIKLHDQGNWRKKLKNKDQIKIFFPSNSEPVRCGQPPTLAWLELWEAAMEKASATMVPPYWSGLKCPWKRQVQQYLKQMWCIFKRIVLTEWQEGSCFNSFVCISLRLQFVE